MHTIPPTSNPNQKRIFTVPNMLSFVRVVIPVTVWIYFIAANKPIAAGSIFVIFGLTDIIDGFIARKFRMMSDLGKILDPIANKLTQAAM